MSRKDKIRQLFKSSGSSDDGTFNPWFRVKLVLVILIVLFIVEVMVSFAWINRYNIENEHLTAEIRDLQSAYMDRIAWQNIVRAYNDNLPITITSNRNTGDTIKLKGYIKNTGTREIGTITLTAMCLDESSFPVCKQVNTVRSSDGNPLKQYQRRRFNITIDSPPDNSKTVQVFVSNIEFIN
jgi:archaellum component FlaG (FlaF/FlaG flagellin family)